MLLYTMSPEQMACRSGTCTIVASAPSAPPIVRNRRGWPSRSDSCELVKVGTTGDLRKLPGEPGVPARHDFGGGLATRLVDDLLIAGHQLGVGKGVQHWPGPEEVVGVTVGYEDRVGSLAGILHPRRQPLSLARGKHASTRTASRSPEISVEVLAGQVAGVLSSHPGTTRYRLVPAI